MEGEGNLILAQFLGLESDGSLHLRDRARQIRNSTIWGCAPTSVSMIYFADAKYLAYEVNMFDNLRESASSLRRRTE